jgi:hypothetical protein
MPKNIRGRLLAAGSAVLVVAALLVYASVSTASAATTTVLPTADAHVQADFPTTNYGTSTTLRIDNSPVANGYLKFAVSGLTDPVTKATLRLFARTTATTAVTVSSVADTPWTETGITYDTAPAIGAQIGTTGALTAGTWATVDLTSAVKGDGTYSFALKTTSSTSRSFDSKEGANKPELIIETGTTTTPPTTTTTTPTTTTAPPPSTPGAPIADAQVQADFPSTNYGRETTLRIDNSPVANGYLKFDVSGVTVTKATLRLFARTTTTTAVTVSSVADNTWTETGITYSNAPAIGAQVGTTGALTAGTWATADLTSAVKGNGTYSFALKTTSTSSRSFDSKEGANPPQLVIETGTTTTTPTTTTPTTTTPTTTTPTTTTPTTTTPPPPSGDPVVVVGGDVACAPTDANYNGGSGVPSYCHMKTTAGLISQINPSHLLMVGDGQYNSGSLSNYQSSYDPAWGQHKAKTNPAVGNHDYGTSGAGGYFSYFGHAASPQQSGCVKDCLGYYSFDVGAWHLVNINSECSRLNGGAGCAVGSPQETWLKNDLAAHSNACTIVFDHRPRWSSNSFASADIAPLVSDMDAAHVDLLLSGHSHSYERFAPQNASGGSSSTGVRQFVVGTGGAFFTGFSTIVPNSQVHKSNIFGVMKLTLHSNSYDWSFVADPSTPYSDSGTGSCH